MDNKIRRVRFQAQKNTVRCVSKQVCLQSLCKRRKLAYPTLSYGVSIRDEGALIAMGRVLVTGACNFEIVRRCC